MMLMECMETNNTDMSVQVVEDDLLVRNQMEIDLDEIAFLLESNPFVLSGLLDPDNRSRDDVNVSNMSSTNNLRKGRRKKVNYVTKMCRNNRVLFEPGVTSEYSSHYCIGGDTGYELQANGKPQVAIDRYFRRCTFRNLGLNANGTLIYHLNPATLDSNEFYGYYKKRAGELEKHYSIGLEFVGKPIEPGNYTHHFNESDPSHCIVFAHDGDYGHIPGHDFDSMWNAFNTLTSTGMLSMENEIVLKRKKSHLNQNIQDALRRAELKGMPVRKFWFTVARTVSNSDVFLKNHAGSILPCVVFANSHKTQMTFPTFQNGLVPRIYRDRAMIIQNVEVAQESKRPKIAVRFKDQGHAFTNHDAIVAHLHTRYGSAIVTDYRGNQTTPLADELRTLASQDIYITPAGGGSYGGIFVRDGRTVVYGNVCWTGRVRRAGSDPMSYGQHYRDKNGTEVYCIRQDNFVWSLMPYYHKRYLNAARASDIVPATYEKPYEKRVHAHLLLNSYHVNLTILESFVDEALINMGFGKFATSKAGFNV